MAKEFGVPPGPATRDALGATAGLASTEPATGADRAPTPQAPTAVTPYTAVVALLRREPALVAINAAVEQRSRHHADRRLEVGHG